MGGMSTNGNSLTSTHYTKSQRAMFAARRANATKATAGRMSHGSKTKFGVAETTIDEAAREAGVAASAVVEAKRIRREAAPEVVRAVRPET